MNPLYSTLPSLHSKTRIMLFHHRGKYQLISMLVEFHIYVNEVKCLSGPKLII